MASRDPKSDNVPIVVIVGETGSGKSALAIELAQRFNGEIIAADSRTVYKGMDIGTAKPTAAERQAIPHHGLDVATPAEQFTAYDFQELAEQAVRDISNRGKLPIVVGGTGLYIDAFLYGFRFRPPAEATVRAQLQQLTARELQERVIDLGLPMPKNATNPRHLIRLLEAGRAPEQPRRLRPHTLVVGLRVPKLELQTRIERRVEAMFAAGLVAEVQTLIDTYGSTEALKAPGYKAVGAYLKGAISIVEAKRQFVRYDLQLAKRQRTWFKRNADIRWLEGSGQSEAVVEVVSDFLAV